MTCLALACAVRIRWDSTCLRTAGASPRDSLSAGRQRMNSKTQCWVRPLPEPSPASVQVPCFRYNNQALFHPLSSAPRGARAVNDTSHAERVPPAVITLTLLPPSTSSWCKNSLGSKTLLIWPQSNPSFWSCSLCLWERSGFLLTYSYMPTVKIRKGDYTIKQNP